MEKLFQKALENFKTQNYEGTLENLSHVLKTTPENYQAIITKARCQLALSLTDDASLTYASILDYPKSALFAQAEAKLFFGNFQESLSILAEAIKKMPENGELYFLSALSFYKNGNILKTLSNLELATKHDFLWEDEDSVNFLVSHVLQKYEYYDFEQIYLDIFEANIEGKNNPQNRWFSINIPIFELFSARPENQPQKVNSFAQVLGESFVSNDIDFANNNLEKILRDFVSQQEDARFGLEALKNFSEKKYSQVASIILAMQLEHLKGFGQFFELEEETIKNAQLQNLIPLLPFRIALTLMFLYAASDPKDKIQQMALQNLEPGLYVNMISICFSSFYREIGQYKK
jgi:hypothetical protein